MSKDFADRVRELREERKLSQNELATASKIPAANLSRILSGERPLRMEQAVSIAQALGVTVIELTAGTTVEEVVAEWIRREEYEAADRLRADAERDLELARSELAANKAENTSLREGVRSLTSRITALETELASQPAEAARATLLGKKNGELERQVVQLGGDVARLTSHVERLTARASSAVDLANQNYQAWAQAKNRVEVLEKTLASEKSDKVGVAFVSAALGGLAAAMIASPAQTGRRRRS
jgi:transcriptional regulator with XRE-family HTH domain